MDRGHDTILRSRRDFMIKSVISAIGSSCWLSNRKSHALVTDGSKRFENLLAELESSPELVENSRGYREFAQFFPELGLERAPSRSAPSNLPISSRAADLIVYCEVSSPETYRKLYQRPIWPKGLSGVTIGVGYDLGYTTPKLVQSDWGTYLGKATVEKLSEACRVTGPAAQPLAAALQSIEIPWSLAKAQYYEREQPRYVGLTQRSLPNLSQLPLDARGALVSLVYNRGPTFNVPASKDPTNRYVEMRNILALMRLKHFAAIPDEIRKMKRLWLDDPNLAGVVKRRELEATLFEVGLGIG
jgi:hypothetical protein